MNDDGRYAGERIVIFPSRIKMLLILLGALMFVLLGIGIGRYGLSYGVPLWEIFVATGIGVPFFGACGLYAAYRLVWRRPAVTIDSTGITDTSSAIGCGHLGWDEVDRVVVHRYKGQWMLGIMPKDLDGFFHRQPAARGYVLKLNLALGIPPINVAQVGLNMRVSELAETLRTLYGVRVDGEV